MQKFKGKVFVNNGVDQETGAYPLQVNPPVAKNNLKNNV
jgi:hypothetical protein